MLNNIIILIVDDNPDLLYLLRIFLSKNNVSVIEACSGYEALNLLEGNKVDFIISDISMPGMDGNAFIKEVRKRNIIIPAIAFSAHKEEIGKKEALISGFNRYVEKPQMETLINAIRSLHRNH